MKISAFLLIVLFPVLLIAQNTLPIWVNSVQDTSLQAMTIGFEVDAAGNNYTLGYAVDTTQPWANAQYVSLIKYDANGQLQWIDTFQLSSSGLNAKMELGQDGYIYIASRLATGPYTGEFLILRISPLGTQLWRNSYSPPAEVGLINGIAIDYDANVCVVGTSVNNDSTLLMKCDSAGNLAWATGYSHIPMLDDRGNAIAIDYVGNTYVAVESNDIDTTYSFVLLKYSLFGQLVWERRFNVFDQQGASMLVVPNDSVIVVTGYCTNFLTSTNILTLKYDDNGNLIWWQEFDSNVVPNTPLDGTDTPADIIVTRSGKIAIAGECANNGMPQWMNLLYDQNGNLLWVRREYDICWARAVEEDISCNLIFAADALDTVNNVGGIGVCKYDTLGNNLWRTIYSSLPIPGPTWTRMELDSTGNIYCTGISRLAPEHHFITLKFDYTVSVEETVAESELNIYPNPASDHLTFEFAGPMERTIVMFDALGQEVLLIKSDKSLINFSIDALSPGMYIYQIEDGSKLVSGKILVY